VAESNFRFLRSAHRAPSAGRHDQVCRSFADESGHRTLSGQGGEHMHWFDSNDPWARGLHDPAGAELIQ
jgi:hypothetical protein